MRDPRSEKWRQEALNELKKLQAKWERRVVIVGIVGTPEWAPSTDDFVTQNIEMVTNHKTAAEEMVKRILPLLEDSK